MHKILTQKELFITGGSGYLGRYLLPHLLATGHSVRALVREQSQSRLPPGCTSVVGDALDHTTYLDAVTAVHTWVHLVGVSHPNPLKAKLFRQVDLVSVREALKVAVENKIEHFVYVSVAQPAPVMKSYIRVRSECEALIRASGLNATILRPWYVLGPGHWWPYLIVPMYHILEKIPATTAAARRLGLIRLPQMVAALVNAIENPPEGIRVLEVPQLRQYKGSLQPALKLS